MDFSIQPLTIFQEAKMIFIIIHAGLSRINLGKISNYNIENSKRMTNAYVVYFLNLLPKIIVLYCHFIKDYEK